MKNFVPNYGSFIVFIWAIALPARAEIALGTLQNPVTGDYTENVSQDWKEGIVRDSITGNYIITYKHGEEKYYFSIVYEPSTKIEPTIRSSFVSPESDNFIAYKYQLTNSTKSTQDIHTLSSIVVDVIPDGLDSPKDWDGTTVPTMTDQNLILSWTHFKEDTYGGLAPGASLSGFAIRSTGLPGVAIAQIRGNGKNAVWLGHSPDPATPVGKQSQQLLLNDHVARKIAVPLIRVSNPYNAAAVISALQKHIDADLANLKLVDPVIVSELDRWLSAARSAADNGNNEALRAAIREARQVLRRECLNIDSDDSLHQCVLGDGVSGKSGIDKLAAKVLDFDLKYIEIRAIGKLSN